MPLNTHHPHPAPKAESGFTLLELVIAITLLSLFVVNLFDVLDASHIRSIRYTQKRQVKSLAQQKLHDRINFRIEENEGDFEEEGHPSWSWFIEDPQPRSQGEQIVLEYTINVEVPFQIGSTSSESTQLGNLSSESSLSRNGSVYQYTTWTFPSEAWREEQDYLYQNGMESLLYGDPDYYNEALPAANTGAGR